MQAAPGASMTGGTGCGVYLPAAGATLQAEG